MDDNDYQIYRNIIHSLYYIGHKCFTIAEERMKPYKISFPQSVVLHIIFNNKDKNICQKDIVDILGVKGSSVTSIINTMSKNNLIERIQCSNDARKIIIKGTEKGKDIYEKISSDVMNSDTHLFDNLTREEKELLLNILLKIN